MKSAKTKAAGGGARTRAAFYTAGAALAVMAIATVVTDSGTGGSGVTAIADAGYTSISQTPGNAPSVAFAKPQVAPTSFAGKDWPGMGSFGEHWAKPGAGVGQGEHP